MPPLPRCQVQPSGVVEYVEAWERQRELSLQVHDGTQPNTLILLEHPPVYTIGRRGKRDQVLLSDDELREIGIALYEADRGGEVTYHGPGQLVAYPVLDLKGWGGPVKYVRTLEQIIIATLMDFGVESGVVDGMTGVWVGNEKIAAIGVKLSRGVTYHGFSINVSTDLSPYEHIIPCGILDRGVTSVEKLLGTPVGVDEVAYSLTYHFGAQMGFRMEEVESLPEGIPAETASLAGD